jgi:hypothetical protein
MRIRSRPASRNLRLQGLRHVTAALVLVQSAACAAADADVAAVGAAIDRGVDYLARTQASDGSWNSFGHQLGETALAGLAIVSAGRPIDSPQVTAAAHAVRRGVATVPSTYDISLVIMFLDRLGRPEDAQLLRNLSLRLMGGQCFDGSWSYDLPLAAAGGSQRQSGGSSGDNSNTQFAAIAAWIGRRHGLNNDAALQRLDRHFRNTFDPASGGWAYGSHGAATPTMTCAGLVGLATHRGAEKQRIGDEAAPSRSSEPAGRGAAARGRAADDPVAKRALQALGQELLLANRNGGAPINQDLYFFWSLERVGVIYDIRSIGGVDWYHWGAERLVKGQLPNGEWSGVSSSKGWRFEANVGTSFAILFLSKANVAADLTAQVGNGDVVERGGNVPEDLAPPGLGGGSQFMQRAGKADSPPPSPGAQPPRERKQQLRSDSRLPPKRKPAAEPGPLEPF